MNKMENTKNYLNEPIGEWKIGDEEHFISFALKTKPSWFHRLSARFFFGLRWVDFVSTRPSKGIKVGGTSQGTPNRRFKS
jgi:hypothetical protein